MRIAVGLCLSFLFQSASLGGTVTFDPDPFLDSKYIWGTQGGGPFVDVWVEPEAMQNFQFVQLVIGSDSLQLLGFEYSPDFLAAAGLTSPIVADPIFSDWTWSFAVGGMLQSPVDRIWVGTLEFFGIGEGEYSIEVDGQRDAGFSRIMNTSGESEELNGYGHVFLGVPEPSTLALLAMGTLTILRRPSRIKPPLPLG